MNWNSSAAIGGKWKSFMAFWIICYFACSEASSLSYNDFALVFAALLQLKFNIMKCLTNLSAFLMFCTSFKNWKTIQFSAKLLCCVSITAKWLPNICHSNLTQLKSSVLPFLLSLVATMTLLWFRCCLSICTVISFSA